MCVCLCVCLCAYVSVSVHQSCNLTPLPFPSLSLPQHVLIFMMSLAVAALFGDAILHLIPHALGLHDHGSEDDGHDHEGGHDYTYLWKVCVSACA